MREISAEAVADTVARLCVQANTCLPRDVKDGIAAARAAEDWPPAREILDRIVENGEIGGGFPICQDTGMACVFLEVGQELHIAGDLAQAVDEGVRRGYAQGYLRKSVVSDPLERVNSGDNTPAMLYTQLVPGDRLVVTVAPKGFGSENMSRIAMLKPSDGVEGVKDFIVDTVEQARSALHRIAKEDFAVVYLTEQFAAQMEADIARYKDELTPAVILIPGKEGSLGLGMANVKKSVERAVGADIL